MIRRLLFSYAVSDFCRIAVGSIVHNFKRLFILMASRSQELSEQAYSSGLAKLSVVLGQSVHSLRMRSLDPLPSRESPGGLVSPSLIMR